MKLNKEIHFDEALEIFNSVKVATATAKELCKRYDIEYDESEGRKVRKWLNPEINLPLRKGDKDYTPKILVYDIETSLIEGTFWWTGKQFISHHQLKSEGKIISISYKYLGEDKVYALSWDNDNKCDKELIRKFVEIYNNADMIIGQNSDNFDNRYVAARAMKYGFDLNTYVKSFDLMKQTKKLFRLPSYSMDYLCKYLGISGKLEHTGRKMWDDIQYGNRKTSREALKLMLEYNKKDVLVTEEIYLKLRKYMGNVTHLGVLSGESKVSCPNCGSTNIELYKTIITASGTIRRVMRCKKDKVLFSISNRDFLRLQ